MQLLPSKKGPKIVFILSHIFHFTSLILNAIFSRQSTSQLIATFCFFFFFFYLPFRRVFLSIWLLAILKKTKFQQFGYCVFKRNTFLLFHSMASVILGCIWPEGKTKQNATVRFYHSLNKQSIFDAYQINIYRKYKSILKTLNIMSLMNVFRFLDEKPKIKNC